MTLVFHHLNLVFLFLSLVLVQAEEKECLINDQFCHEQRDFINYEVPPGCSAVMAKSSLGGWGTFSLQDRKRGGPVLFGDVVIHLTDILNRSGIEHLLDAYSWDAHKTGGMLEGHRNVFSIVPGLGMMANAASNEHSNVLPYRPSKDDGNCARESCAAAGSFSHYHNYTWFIHKDVVAGQEFLVRRQDLENHEVLKDEGWKNISGTPKRSVKWLRQNGICLDNLRPRRETPGAGRGVISTRHIPKNTVVSPVPVVSIFEWETSMNYVRKVISTPARKSDSSQHLWQLLINYSFGHVNSSMLLHPYSPIVNLINHGDKEKANVRLQWSQHTDLFPHKEWLDKNLDALKNAKEPGLLLELIATRNISIGEEVWLDYGADWVAAWDVHKTNTWKPFVGRNTPALVMDEVAKKLRTSKEQKDYPYADNLQTFCFHDFLPNGDQVSTPTGGITAVPWNWTRRVFDWENFRPCTILHRDDTTGLYIAQIRNRHGTPIQVPKRHIVSKIPRPAIRLADKPQTTDQHLPNAFRHWIGIPDGIFPEKWKDK